MHVNFVSSNDTGETHTIFEWSDNEEIRLGNQTDDIIKRLINSFLNDFQKEIILRNGSNVVFGSVDLLSYHIHKTGLRRGSSCFKSPEWIANKKATINPKNKGGDNKCFQYSIIAALNHQKFDSHPERISNLHDDVFNEYCNWDGIEFPVGKNDWKRFEKNYKTIALNILSVPHDEKKILHINQNIIVNVKIKYFLLMITDCKKRHYIALKSETTDDGFNRPTKSSSKLYRGITSNHLMNNIKSSNQLFTFI